MEVVGLKFIPNVIVFSILGLVVLAVSFMVFDRLTPGNLWKEIVEEHNIALAIVTGCFAIAMAIVIASAVHG